MRKLILILAAVLIVGCNNSDNTTKTSNGVVAVIGSENITTDELNDELGKLSFRQKSIYASNPNKLYEFLQARINEKVLYDEALQSGVGEREDIKQEIERYSTKLITKTHGREILEELEPSEEDIASYYEQNKKDYERIDISKILIYYDPQKDESKKDALSRAELVLKRARNGENFQELAAEFSDDPASKKNGGKVGYVKRGRFPQEIDAEIFELKEGEITTPFEVDRGYLIIKANKEPDFAPLNQVERNIRSELVNEKLQAYLNNLWVERGVKIYEERLQEMIKSEPEQK